MAIQVIKMKDTFSEKMKTAMNKMEEIRDFYFEGCEILFKPVGEPYVMFNIMGEDGKPIQSFLWNENVSTKDKPAFQDWTKIQNGLN